VSPKSEPTPRTADGPRVCSIANALEPVGDRWSLLVNRELGFGVRRFTEIQRNTGAPREMLTARLRKLEQVGVIAREQYQEKPARYEYTLTDAGSALLPVLPVLRSLRE
jgi:DNA-binding HxlR family transcriptional regulator